MKKQTVYIILFRGVGGKTQLPVKLLKERLVEAGFENVATYINSGNAVVRSSLPAKSVIRKIADLCREHFGFDKAIFAPTLEEWQKVIANNPFAAGAAEAPTTVHAALLEEKPKAGAAEALLAHAAEGEDLKVIGNVAYIHTPHGFGRSKLAEKFYKGIGVTNTARNWNSVVKLAELAEKSR